jgi:hypothetical protein
LLANYRLFQSRDRLAPEEFMSTLAITHNLDIEAAITEALDHLPVEKLVRDRIVAIHPNDTWASDADKSAVTQPDSLRAVLRYLKRFAPKELIVTGGSGAGETMERRPPPKTQLRAPNREREK